MQIVNQDNPKLVLDGEEYEIEKLNDNCKYFIDQCRDLNQQLTQLRGKMHQVEVSRAGFITLLRDEIDAQNRVFKDEEKNEQEAAS